MNAPVTPGPGLAPASHKIAASRSATTGGREANADEFKLNLRKAIPVRPADADELQVAGEPGGQDDAADRAATAASGSSLEAVMIGRIAVQWGMVLPANANGQPPIVATNGGRRCAAGAGDGIALALASEAGDGIALALAGEAGEAGSRQPIATGAAAQAVGRPPEGDVPSGGLPKLPVIPGLAVGAFAADDRQGPLPDEAEKPSLAGIQVHEEVSAGVHGKQERQWDAALARRTQEPSGPAVQSPIAEQRAGAPEIVAGNLKGADNASVARQVADVVLKEGEAVLPDLRLPGKVVARATGHVRRLSLDLMPAHLGQLRIELSRSETGELEITMTASSEQSAKLIQGQVNELINTLKGSGVELGLVLVHAPDNAAGAARQPSFMLSGQMLQDAASQAGQEHRDNTGQSVQETADEATAANGHRDDHHSAGVSDGVYI